LLTLDVFHSDPFTAIELTAAVDRIPFKPMGLGSLNLFEDFPIRTKALMVERRDQQLQLIPSSPRGAPAIERTTERREAFYFEVPRLRHGDTVYAEEVQSIRAFGTETELMQVQAEVARRLGGPTGIVSNIEYTWEYHRLAAIQGFLLDADGSVIYNWYTQFGITPNPTYHFALSSQTVGSLQPICNRIQRAVARAARGAFIPGQARVLALCGDTFWDQFTSHPDVRQTFLNWSAAQDLRTARAFDPDIYNPGMLAFQTLAFGGIDWYNYRGSDDNSTIAIAPTAALFFPVGAPGIFRVAWAPAENMEFVNTLGKPIYIQPILDRDRMEWWRMEATSYPLHICTRPEVLNTGAAT
jgi:Phage major capsid protein E